MVYRPILLHLLRSSSLQVDVGWEERVKFDSQSGGDSLKQNDNLDKAMKGDSGRQ